MSASVSARRPTGKFRRSLALIAGPLLAMGAVVGSGGNAQAASLVFIPAQVHLSNGYCSISGWPGGTIFCNTGIGANVPNGTQEIFGIGTNGGLWTDWGTEAKPSGWRSLSPSGMCNGHGQVNLGNDGNYGLAFECVSGGTSGVVGISRSDGPNGRWGAWQVIGFPI